MVCSASLPGFAGTLATVLTFSGPGSGNVKSAGNVLVRDNTALLVNNVAGVGGDEAINILSRCKPLISILVELLSSHDAPVVLQRFVGCFNHLSRSVQVSCQFF